MIWPFTRDCTETDSIGCTVPSALMTIGTSFCTTVAATTGTAASACGCCSEAPAKRRQAYSAAPRAAAAMIAMTSADRGRTRMVLLAVGARRDRVDSGASSVLITRQGARLFRAGHKPRQFNSTSCSRLREREGREVVATGGLNAHRTAFLPWWRASAISDFTSYGVDTSLPPTSRMTSSRFWSCKGSTGGWSDMTFLILLLSPLTAA